MRSSQAGALIWRSGLGERRLEPAHQGARRLKHLRVLVEVRCTADRPHELGYVYKLPGDVLPKVLEHLPFLHGELLFVSMVDATKARNGKSIVEAKRDSIDRIEAIDQRYGRSGNYVRGLRMRDALVDLLDFRPDDDGEHSDLVTRCRCGERPPADRHELVRLAREALADGKTRHVFL